MPPMDMLAPPIPESSTLEPTVSQINIEHQMRQLTKSLTTSIGSMFERLNQSMDDKFKQLSEELSQLKARMDLYDPIAPT